MYPYKELAGLELRKRAIFNHRVVKSSALTKNKGFCRLG